MGKEYVVATTFYILFVVLYSFRKVCLTFYAKYTILVFAKQAMQKDSVSPFVKEILHGLMFQQKGITKEKPYQRIAAKPINYRKANWQISWELPARQSPLLK